jgi:hypothetical protein
MRTWRRRLAAAMVALAAFTGVLVASPQPAMAISFTSCGFGSSAISNVVSANATYHDIYWGVTLPMGGAVDVWIRDADTEQTIFYRYVYWTGSDLHQETGRITGLYGRYYMALWCHGGYTTAYLS